MPTTALTTENVRTACSYLDQLAGDLEARAAMVRQYAAMLRTEHDGVVAGDPVAARRFAGTCTTVVREVTERTTRTPSHLGFVAGLLLDAAVAQVAEVSAL